MNNITSIKEKENIDTTKTTIVSKTWSKVKKRILKIWYKNRL